MCSINKIAITIFPYSYFHLYKSLNMLTVFCVIHKKGELNAATFLGRVSDFLN